MACQGGRIAAACILRAICMHFGRCLLGVANSFCEQLGLLERMQDCKLSTGMVLAGCPSHACTKVFQPGLLVDSLHSQPSVLCRGAMQISLQVVRRRAVPREVNGPPPGSDVWQWTPVVFFTTSGVPGEVTEGMDSAHGALAACMRALRLPGEASRQELCCCRAGVRCTV